MRPDQTLDVPGPARALVSYCDAVGVERATFVGNSLGCPIIVEFVSTSPTASSERCWSRRPGARTTNHWGIGQMAMDGPREPMSMVPIAVRDYLRFGVLQSLSISRR